MNTITMAKQPIEPAELVLLISGLLQDVNKPFYTTSFAVQGGNRYLDLLSGTFFIPIVIRD